MSDYLPPELWSEVFLKLPVKSVIRSTAVCKQWQSIITSPAFISDHLSLSRQNPLLLTLPIAPRSNDPNTLCLHLDTESDNGDSPDLRLSQTLHCPFLTGQNGPSQVVGCVDGLVLLSDNDLHRHRHMTNAMVLWNPSIRKSVTLPRPLFTFHDFRPYIFMLGFGLDSASGDYKVVLLVYPESEEFYEPPPLVEVYSLRDRTWRTVVSDNVDYMPRCSGWSHCFIHGAVHWIGIKIDEPGRRFGVAILLFDLGTEEFKTMALPQVEIDAVKTPLQFFMSVVGGLMYVSVNHVSYTNIWVKKDYYADSWTKIVSLDMKNRQVGAWLDLRRCCGDIMKEMGGVGGANGFGDIQVPPKVCFGLKFLDEFVFSYTESLVLLDEEDRDVQEGS